MFGNLFACSSPWDCSRASKRDRYSVKPQPWSGGDDDFKGLLAEQFASLQQLIASKHESEIAKLRLENEMLKRALASQQSTRVDDIKHPTFETMDVNNIELDLDHQKDHSRLSSRSNSSAMSEAAKALKKSQSMKPKNKFSKAASKLRSFSGTNLQVELYPVFQDGDSQMEYESIVIQPTVQGLNKQLNNTIRAGDEVVDSEEWKRYLVLHPHKLPRAIYDVVTMIIMGIELIHIPADFAGLLSERGATRTSWFATCWWTVDLIVGFLKGYPVAGVVEMRLKQTAINYLKSWFLLDFPLLVLDWTTLLFLNMDTTVIGVLRSFKTVRMAKLFRFIRLLRMYPAVRVPRQLEVACNSMYVQTLISVSTWMIFMLTISHICACLWCALGQVEWEVPTWWQASERLYIQRSDKDWEHPGAFYMYTTALHWTVTQFTAMKAEVNPANGYERIYAITWALGAISIFTSFVASITGAVMNIRTKSAEITKWKSNLEKYLQENRISMHLSSCVQDCVLAQYTTMKQEQRLHEADVDLLKFLPRSLKEQLHVEVFEDTVRWHPFLQVLDLYVDDGATMRKVYNSAMSEQSLKPSQDLFQYGTAAEKMFFVVAGQLFYFKGANPSPDFDGKVGEGEFICDQVLWMKWTHMGRLTAGSHVEIVTLDGNVFRQIVEKKDTVKDVCRRYAAAWTQALQVKDIVLTDLPCSPEIIQDVIYDVLNITWEQDDEGGHTEEKRA